ncbi:hypothetical protein Y1Q_0012420 [Alligator mississippiensis]|uniref:Uncharacterized protein n=1 Tax=Alligator mississippiensis TaxID=8496 RepID=A0A151NCM7_ALLMI|nr:hypothetical protein Y1Q_0012420 [Alligator mississippiensis]
MQGQCMLPKTSSWPAGAILWLPTRLRAAGLQQSQEAPRNPAEKQLVTETAGRVSTMGATGLVPLLRGHLSFCCNRVVYTLSLMGGCSP